MWHRRATLLGLLLIGAEATAETSPQAAPLQELMRHLAAVPESRASFVEEKTVAALAEPVRSQGRLVYRRPDYLEKMTTAPVSERLVVDGDRLWLVLNGHSPRMIDLRSEPAVAALVDAIRGTLSGDLPMLNRSYAVTMEGGFDSWRLILTPRTAPITDMLRQAIIEGSGTALRRVTTVQPNGDRSVLTIGAPDPAAS